MTPLSVEAASELRDALSRRQKELPPRWLAALDATMLADAVTPPAGHALESIEREIGLAALRESLGEAQPRGVVCLRPSASGANASLVEALCARGSVTAIATTELDGALATRMLDRIAPLGVRASSIAVTCDCTVELPRLDRLPRPRVYLALGNVLGSTTAVGAVRALRVMRSTMMPGDTIILGLTARRTVAPDEFDAAAERHLRALELLNSTVGAGFDLGRFEFRPTFDIENSRAETHLVARKALAVAVPGVCDVRFKKGESIRTSVSCTFDRGRVSAMLTGVGLTLREWITDPHARWVVALATPAA